MSNTSTNSSVEVGIGRNRRIDTEEYKMFLQRYFCFGHCPKITKYLEEKSGKIWLLPKFLDALFRGIAQVLYANNPFTGIHILMGLFWTNIFTGCIVLISTCGAVLTAAIFGQNPEDISAGLMSFNAVLLSSVTSSLWTPLYGEPIGYKMFLFILIGSSISVIISNGLGSIFSSLKPNLPILSVPFHILVFTIFACLKPAPKIMTGDASRDLNSLNETLFNHTSMISPEDESLIDFDAMSSASMYSWNSLQTILFAVIYSGSQVFGSANAIAALLNYSGLLMYSPMLTLMCLYGALLGTILGFLLTPFPNDEVFLGLWGFNGLLSCGAIGLFYVVNFFSVLNATACTVLTAVFQLALTPQFASSQMPVFGLPFILSTILFLCVTSKGDQLVRCTKITYPELQRKNHQKICAQHHDNVQSNGNSQLLNA